MNRKGEREMVIKKKVISFLSDSDKKNNAPSCLPGHNTQLVDIFIIMNWQRSPHIKKECL